MCQEKLKKIEKIEETLWENLKKCTLCPRMCGINRYEKTGFCGLGDRPKISNAVLHFGEEPPISGKGGAGTIFFSGCNMKCVYCQNMGFSQMGVGTEIDVEDLADIFLILQEHGAQTLNLVTPTPQLPFIISALRISLSKGLKIPIVYNTSGYENPETLKLLDSIVDIYLADLRYSNDFSSQKYSKTPNYWTIAQKAVIEMFRQVGAFNEEKMKGLIVRILILPGKVVDYREFFSFLSTLSTRIPLSLMSQYLPHFDAKKFPEINRRVHQTEYEEVLEMAEEFGFVEGWYQSEEKERVTARGVKEISEKLKSLQLKAYNSL
ncbi:radical SAM protein [Thermotoga sp. KOL6]|uniref:radical SAM protein n=1 Tax=Thermotoga sp. KOL6 TaxID=126741 RepID=UPI000C773C53|nr:radical SAM protein [Thermotoga sp. KOL6]PLV58706.1 radical SAM protein [Thermotoga sp. KOL6]